MGLSYHYEFEAPASVTAKALEQFLHAVKHTADSLGFGPNAVLNLPFDNPDRQDFSRRLGGSFLLEDERLKGVDLPTSGPLRRHDAASGSGLLTPEHGVILVVVDGRQEWEVCFGFFRFPNEIVDVHGRLVMRTPFGGRWAYRNQVDSSDPRYRQIVAQFAAAGYLVTVRDEFVQSH